MKHPRTSLLAVAVTLGLSVIGCSGSASGNDATQGTAAARTPPYAHLTGKQINDALLTYKDMPPGYSEAQDSASAKDHTYCNYKQPTKAVVKGTRSFNKGGGLSQQFASISIREYASRAAAKKAWEAMNKVLTTCHRETYQGEKLKYAPMSAPKVGDDSVGVQMTVADPTVGHMTVMQNFALVGPSLVSTGVGGLMNVDADQAANLLKQQVAAYKDAALE